MVSFFPINHLATAAYIRHESQSYKFVVIIAKENDNYIFCRHIERNTWELPGGHIENVESPLEAAKRELFEETGAREFSIRPIFDYRVTRENIYSDGVIYLADVTKRGELPESEIAEVRLSKEIPEDMTYPLIQPLIMEHYIKLFCNKPKYLYHASKIKLDKLIPVIATGYKEENGDLNGIYAYETFEQCIPFALSFSEKSSIFIDDLTSEVFLLSGELIKGTIGYIYKLSSGNFSRLDELQFLSLEETVPIEVTQISADDYQNIVHVVK